jgi:hypothetical protein
MADAGGEDAATDPPDVVRVQIATDDAGPSAAPADAEAPAVDAGHVDPPAVDAGPATATADASDGGISAMCCTADGTCSAPQDFGTPGPDNAHNFCGTLDHDSGYYDIPTPDYAVDCTNFAPTHVVFSDGHPASCMAQSTSSYNPSFGVTTYWCCVHQ